uniref:NR LBD domain-containing protein n=1 Tax=Strigamia maritima TaxID=126957 RepID=T1JNK8_STRMM
MNVTGDPSPETSADCSPWMGPQIGTPTTSPRVIHRSVTGDSTSCDGGPIDVETRQLGRVMTEKVVIGDEGVIETVQETDKTIVNGHVGVVNLRVKKQRIAPNITPPVPVNAAIDQERPMSWEGELSDDDLLSCDGGTKTPSTLTEDSCKSPSTMIMEPGSPMSVNGSDKDEPILNQRKPVAEIPMLKPVSPYSSRPHSQNPSPVQPRHLAAAGLNHPIITGLPDAASSAAHYFTPQASPLQARHVNGHSYSSSSSPELAKHLFYSPTQSPIQSRHMSNVGSPYSQSLSPRHANSQETTTSTITTTSTTPFSPSQSPVQSRHVTSQDSPYSSPYSSVGSPSGSSSIPFSPNQSPVQSRHPSLIACASSVDPSTSQFSSKHHLQGHLAATGTESALENSVVRTVQNKKNYLCLRGATCPVSVNTRKKCPACRFDKCLKMGMKLEAIREDRTRGGRSTYQCSYTLPSTMMHDGKLMEAGASFGDGVIDIAEDLSLRLNHGADVASKSARGGIHEPSIPVLIQEIMSVEHLWHYSEGDSEKMGEPFSCTSAERGPDFFSNLCNIADHRLYKIVKWCKSLPLFRNIQIDDQICLLLNSWCELLLLSCCFRSIPTPDEIRVSLGKSLNLGQARTIGLDHVIERMLNLTEHLRRLRIDQYEYVCLKVIILLTSDVTGLKQPESVRQSQEKVIQALQSYSLSHYPLHPSKFGELLLRIPELKRTCLIGKESLSVKHREGEVPSFNLLIELLRGEH